METANLTKPSSTDAAHAPHFLFPDPEVGAALARFEAASGEARAVEADLLRQLLGIPPGGARLRTWLRFQLQQVPNKKTGRTYTQADIARMAGDVAGATVSRVFQGELPGGDLS